MQSKQEKKLRCFSLRCFSLIKTPVSEQNNVETKYLLDPRDCDARGGGWTPAQTPASRRIEVTPRNWRSWILPTATKWVYLIPTPDWGELIPATGCGKLISCHFMRWDSSPTIERNELIVHANVGCKCFIRMRYVDRSPLNEVSWSPASGGDLTPCNLMRLEDPRN